MYWLPGDLLEFQSTLLCKERHYLIAQMIAKIHFNPRSYVRSDVSYLCYKHPSVDFNPRSYVRSDQATGYLKDYLINFNPRSYVRSDKEQEEMENEY